MTKVVKLVRTLIFAKSKLLPYFYTIIIYKTSECPAPRENIQKRKQDYIPATDIVSAMISMHSLIVVLSCGNL